jgi:putative cell wall-binding protein
MATTKTRLAAVAGLLVVALFAGAVPASAQLGPQALIDIGSPVVVKTPNEVTEMNFEVVLDRRSTQTITVMFRTQGASAVDGDDYVALVGSRTFSPGQLRPDEGAIRIQLLANPEEGERRFDVELTQVITANAGFGVRRGTGTIVTRTSDPPSDSPTLDVGNVEVAEGNSGSQTVEFPVVLDPEPTQPVQISYRTSDGTAIAATGDYTAVPTTTLTIPAGQTKTTLPVTVRGDTQSELNEWFEVVITSVTNARIGTGRGRGTILNDDGPHLTVSDVAQLEGAEGELTNFVFTVTLHQPAQNATVTVDYRTEDGTAKAGGDEFVNDGDYIPRAGTLEFPLGATQRTVTVRVVGDDWPEKTEHFYLVLRDAQSTGVTSGVTLLKPRGIGTIINDDGPDITPGDDVEIDQPGQSPVTVEVPVTVEGDDRRMPSNEKFRVRYRTVTGNEADSAEAGVDFEETSGVLEIDRDATEGVITVDILPTPPGHDRWFTLQLFHPDYGRLTGNEVKITILGPLDPGGDVPTETEEVTPGTIVRAAGRDRVATAVEISRNYWQTSESVVLATAENYPDALAGVAIAGGLGAPMLLTPTADLAEPVAGELARLGAQRVWILGGPSAVSSEVEQRLLAEGYETVRLAGPDRFATAAAAARSVGLPDSGEVALALGFHEQEHRAWPDALSAGALAASPDQLPVLLTRGDLIPAVTEEALAELGARRVVLLGGSAAISEAVEARLAELGYETERLSGPNRYATSTAVAGDALGRWGEGRVSVVFATGENFPDGLAAGALAARLDGILVLVPRLALDESVDAFLRTNTARLGGGVVVGGSAAVSDQVHDQLRAALRAE